MHTASALRVSRTAQIGTYRHRGAVVRGVPASIGPVQFGRLGGWVTARCPRRLDPLMRRAGGLWEPGARLWLIEPRRIRPVIRGLERTVDPLFRRAGIHLNG
jgi:hypothetical protein